MIEIDEKLLLGFYSGIMFMAIVHGIFLSSIFLLSKRLNNTSNRFLALSILGACIILFYEFIYWFNISGWIPVWLEYIPLYIRCSIPVGIFYFVYFLIHPKKTPKGIERIGLLILGIEILLQLFFVPLNLIITDTASLELAEFFIDISSWLLCVVASVILLPIALRKVRNYQNQLYKNYSTTRDKSLGWLQNFLIFAISISVVAVFSFFQYLFEYWEALEITFSVVTVGLILMLFWLGYTIILKHRWFHVVQFKEVIPQTDGTSNKLSSKTDSYHLRLLDILQREKLFEDPELTLDRLSDHLNISSGYLSQIINEKENKNFYEFINGFRIESFKGKLFNKEFSHYTILGLALESGFKSKSTFNSVFKKFTGYTPSAYKKKHQKPT